MFDANARHLPKGALFFARKGGDLIFCEMLEDVCRAPRIRLIRSYKNNNDYRNRIHYEMDQDCVSWGWASFSGYVNENGELKSFVCKDELEMARNIMLRGER